jgi:hypothetical protein
MSKCRILHHATFWRLQNSTRTLSFWEIPVAFFQAALLCPRSSPQRSNMRAWKLQLQVLGQGTLIFR